MNGNDFPSKNKVVTAQTHATVGTTYVAFTAEQCTFLRINNDTGVSVEYQLNGAGNAVPVPAAAVRYVFGITNASQVAVRRKDTTTTQVTVQGEALS